ncbi:MAG: hypothetical protein EP299_13445 [Acidobacteria bacterium]|nr:MAG: hypothetical protein EP299_13445 [Acidobacteriota bacterium]
MSVGPDAVRSYLRFVLFLALMAVGTLAVGVFPTRALGGSEAVRGMAVGCGLSFLGSLAGGLPLAVGAGRPPQARGPYLLASMAIRMLVVLGGALVVLLTMEVHRPALLIWVAISYLAFLAIDVGYAVKRGRD